MKKLLRSFTRRLLCVLLLASANAASGGVQRLYAQHCLACQGQDLNRGLGGSLLHRKAWKEVGPEVSFIDYVIRSNDSLGMTRIVRGRIMNNFWMDEEVIFEAPPETHTSSGGHFSCRLAFQDGDLFLSIGDRRQRDRAQELSHLFAKIHRVHDDGRIPVAE